jgi:transposase
VCDGALLGREIAKLGHDVGPIPPAYAKAYVRRNKKEPADAEAICEAVGRLVSTYSVRSAPVSLRPSSALRAAGWMSG